MPRASVPFFIEEEPMRRHLLVAIAMLVTAALAGIGCSQSPAPSSTSAPPAAAATDSTGH